MNDTAPGLDADARARCAVAAALLHGGRITAGLALLAAAGLGLAVLPLPGRTPPPWPLVATALLLLLVERYLALRVALDARLFDDLAGGRCADLATLDRALQQVLAVPAAKGGRSLHARIGGAQRLLGLHALATAALLLMGLWAWRA